ncbi:unnamed protein product [Orchesella dallaii]|uniref:O-acyltransferase WSD1 C-terminal domain-containing protein n=1 Tax=Orchesella dallaii TaxID=48710 RepID=A0ABP1Q6I8_9HEXA
MAVPLINLGVSAGKNLRVALQAMGYFIVFYITMILFSVPLLIILMYRFIVSIIFKYFYKGRYKLVPVSSTFVGQDKVPSVMNLTSFVFIKGSLDIEVVREKILANITRADTKGKIPYEVFLKAVVEKLGFVAFEEKRDSFEIDHHVRLCPKADDPHQIYSEAEMFSAAEKLVHQEWEASKPRWSILLVPNIRKDGTNETCSALVVTIFHVYADGISFAQFLRNCVSDQPPPKLFFDPVNPPIKSLPFHKKILTFIKTFFIAPYILLHLGGCSNEQLLHDDDLKGCNKLMGRSKMRISLDMMRKIRKSFNCSTQAVFHSAFNGALKKIADRKQYKISNEILGGVTLVRLPYPNELPQNRAIMAVELMKVGIEDPIVRLDAINQSVLGLSEKEVLLSCSCLVELVGSLPAQMTKRVFTSMIRLAYYISNIPGIEGRGTFNGQDVSLIFAMGPLLTNQIRISVGLGCYDNSFCVGFVVEKSKLFGSRSDLEELIDEFENELTYLRNACSIFKDKNF